jgi:hypothetical protein
METSDIMSVLVHGLLAMGGGVVRELHVDSSSFSWRQFVSGVLISAFGGIVVFFTCQHFEWDRWFTAMLTSVAGYGGPQALDLIVRAISAKARAQLGLESAPEPKNPGEKGEAPPDEKSEAPPGE